MRSAVPLFSVCLVFIVLFVTGSGCANIIPPGGGPKDSLPPRLVAATPPDSSRNVRPSKITLTFDEYIAQLQNAENIIVSPTVTSIPTIESHLKNVTVKFRDTLEPNTTYSINFANSIKDVNEGNILSNFTYVFSTGSTIDVNSISGKVVVAETGGTDSTLIVLLHSNVADSAIMKLRPKYYTTLNGDGSFTFNNLPAQNFAVYVVPRESFTRQFDSTRMFAFLNKPVAASDSATPVTLYAYVQVKPKVPVTTTPATPGKSADKRLRVNNTEAGSKDILKPLQVEFNRKVKTFDSSKIILADTNYNRLNNYSVKLDSLSTKVVIQYQWKLNTRYKLIIPKDAAADVEGIALLKNDTITFTTKRVEDYGEVRVRFPNVDLNKNPVLQIVQNNVVIESIPLLAKEWKRTMYKPGEYEMRILYDANKNGVWDPGNFELKKQPEIVQPVKQKLTVKANWENQVDITL
jgi:hypothetical protein